MGRGKNKGSAFERKISKRLSEWWTEGERTDIFWRSDSSGARATIRHKVGNTTYGQYGDIQASHPMGQPLVDLCVMELKRGYNKRTIADLLDASDRAAQQKYDKFFQQVIEDYEKSQSIGWMLVAKRDRRQIICYMCSEVYNLLVNVNDHLDNTTPLFTLTVQLKELERVETIVALRFDHFLKYLSRNDIENAVDKWHYYKKLSLGERDVD